MVSGCLQCFTLYGVSNMPNFPNLDSNLSHRIIGTIPSSSVTPLSALTWDSLFRQTSHINPATKTQLHQTDWMPRLDPTIFNHLFPTSHFPPLHLNYLPFISHLYQFQTIKSAKWALPSKPSPPATASTSRRRTPCVLSTTPALFMIPPGLISTTWERSTPLYYFLEK